MATESISVYFESLGSISGLTSLGSILGLTLYHQTIVYTDSDGVQHIATAAYSATNVTGGVINNIYLAADAVKNGTSSPYGTITTQVALASDFSQERLAQLPPLHSDFTAALAGGRDASL